MASPQATQHIASLADAALLGSLLSVSEEIDDNPILHCADLAYNAPALWPSPPPDVLAALPLALSQPQDLSVDQHVEPQTAPHADPRVEHHVDHQPEQLVHQHLEQHVAPQNATQVEPCVDPHQVLLADESNLRRILASHTLLPPSSNPDPEPDHSAYSHQTEAPATSPQYYAPEARDTYASRTPAQAAHDVLGACVMKKGTSSALARDAPQATSSAALAAMMPSLADVLEPISPHPLVSPSSQPFANAATCTPASQSALWPRGPAPCPPQSAILPKSQSAHTPRHKRSQKRSKKYKSPQPSRFCHLCSRTQQTRKLVCSNIANGSCRKSVCELCFRDNPTWDWEAASAPGSLWKCPHCLDMCSSIPKARCLIYKAVNSRRRDARILQRTRSQLESVLRGTADPDVICRGTVSSATSAVSSINSS